MDHSLRGIDHTALKANQAIVAGLLIAAFVGDAIWLVLIVTTIMLLGTILGRPGFIQTHQLRTQLAAIGELKAQPVQKTDPAETLTDERRMGAMPEDTD